MSSAKTQLRLIGLGVALVVGVIVCFNTIGVIRVAGDEAIVRQNMNGGVLRAVNADGSVKYDDVYRDGTHFYFPAFMWDLYRYNIGLQKCTFDSDPNNKDAQYPGIEIAVGSGGGQQVKIAGSINYMIGHRSVPAVVKRTIPAVFAISAEAETTWAQTIEEDTTYSPEYAPDLLVALHLSGNGKNYEDVIIKRTVQEVINSIARPKEALDLYSGAGFNAFREEVDRRLKSHPVFLRRGIYVENTIIYAVHLDAKYEQEIADKQLAVQTKLKEHELQLAAEARAEKVKAEKQADVEAAAQEAEARKQAQMKKAEADKYTVEQEAEATRYQKEQEAAGVLALKVAEATGQQKLTEAMYGGTSGGRRYAVELATNQAAQLKGMLEGVKVITDKALVQLIDDPKVGTAQISVPAGN